MPNTTDTTTTTTPQTGGETRELCETLGLGILKPAELKFLTIALIRVATEEARQNSEFNERIRTLYQSLKPVKAVKPKPEPKPKSQHKAKAPTSTNKVKDKDESKIELIAVGTVDPSELNPYAPLNPWALRRLYGDNQLKTALDRYSADELKRTLPAMQERYPGTAPKKRTKPGILAYIVETILAEEPAEAQPAQ